MKYLLFFTLTLVFSSASYALTFEEALKGASDNSHELKQLRLEQDSANWGETKAIAGFLPKIYLTGRHLFSERFEELEVPFSGTIFVMPAIQPYTSLGGEADLNIFNGFQTSNEVQAASLAKLAADHRLKYGEQRNFTSIRTLFYRALGAQDLVKVADQNIQTLEGHLSDVRARIRSGVSTNYDSLRVDVQLEDARTDRIADEGAVAITRGRLFEAVGRADDGKPLEGKLPEDFSRIDVDKINFMTAAREDRSALIADRDESLRKSSAAAAHWYPNVSLFGTYEWYNNINHSIQESDNRFKTAYTAGVLLTWNLFDGGASYASQRQATLASQIAEEKMNQFDQAMPVDLEQAKRRFTFDVLTFKAKLSSIKKAQEAVRLAKGGVRAGTRTNTEVLDAVVDLNRAKAAAVKSQIDAIEALGQLELSVGHSL